MDELLKALADAGLRTTAAEEAIDEGAPTSAVEDLDAAEAHLQVLRDRWPEMDAMQRRVIGSAATPLRDRIDAARARLPKRRALSEIAPEVDPEQDVDPDAPPGRPT